jgi:acyl transferase domain-containing protein
VGSAKSKLGNNEGAAGITSVIKALLSLERKVIPQSIRPDFAGQMSMIFRQ